MTSTILRLHYGESIWRYPETGNRTRIGQLYQHFDSWPEKSRGSILYISRRALGKYICCLMPLNILSAQSALVGKRRWTSGLLMTSLHLVLLSILEFLAFSVLSSLYPRILSNLPSRLPSNFLCKRWLRYTSWVSDLHSTPPKKNRKKFEKSFLQIDIRKIFVKQRLPEFKS